MCVGDCHENFTLLGRLQDLESRIDRYFSQKVVSHVSSKFLYLYDINFLIYNILSTKTTELFSLFTFSYYADVI
jgi:hypothetical protein